MQHPLFERHDLSSRRRILTVGDIHGRFDLLSQRLDELDFDPERDTLIMLGDLTDRGPYSEAAIDWVDRPGIKRVMGNHDWLVHRVGFGCMGALMIHLRNKGQWFQEITDEAERLRWSKAMGACPIAMEVITPGGRKVGFIHADVPTPTWTQLEAALDASPDPAETYGTIFDCMWKRDRINNLKTHIQRHGTPAGYECHVPGIDHVFFGHTIVQNPLVHDNCSWIDTGAYKRDILTVVDVDDWIIQHQSALAA